MSNLIFKTSEECAVELVACTHSLQKIHDEDLWGNMDMFPARAARVSFAADADTHTEAQDRKLMGYLADHQHLTPFEYQHATFMIECPLFIRSQIHRHRIFSYNEISRRYTSDDLGFWVPTAWRKQAEKNKQASEGRLKGESAADHFLQYKEMCETLQGMYKQMLANGVCREQARAILPQSLLTRFYMGGNLRNWAHFLKLRMDSHAQPEVQIIANRIHEKLTELWPHSAAALLGDSHD